MVQAVEGSSPFSYPTRRFVVRYRAQDCGPEGRRFDPDIPPQDIAGIVQWLVCKFSKLEMRVRFSLPAPLFNFSLI